MMKLKICTFLFFNEIFMWNETYAIHSGIMSTASQFHADKTHITVQFITAYWITIMISVWMFKTKDEWWVEAMKYCTSSV